jgi:SAM-dependent methyltransferase
MATAPTRSSQAVLRPQDLAPHPEVRRVMRPLSGDELSRLERNIMRDGIREPVAVWRQGGSRWILDGHHRWEIALRHGLPVPAREVEGLETLEDALAWAIANQLGRRNLTDNERADLIGREYLLAEKRQGARTDRTSCHSDTKLPDRSRKTSATVARKHHVSPETVHRAARFAQALDALARAVGDEEGVRRAVLATDSRFGQRDVLRLAQVAAGDPGLASAAFGMMASGQARTAAQAIAWAARERARERAQEDGRLARLPEDVRIVCGDFREVCASLPENSVDLVLTDPPYDRDSVPLWDDLGRVAARVLRPGGYLISYCGQVALPDALAALGRHLAYYWVLVNLHATGESVRLWSRRFWVNWKPLLVFCSGDNPWPHRWMSDVVRVPAAHAREAKRLHDWGQPVEEARLLIEAFCPEGGLVLDPMCGGGTVPLAAALCGRRAVGVEIDEQVALRTRARVARALEEGAVSLRAVGECGG